MKLKGIAIIGALLLVSCGQKVEQVDVESMNFPSTEVENGYNLYAQNCNRCHRLKTVDNYTREQWDKILPNMARKAKITDEQQATIDQYINWELGN